MQAPQSYLLNPQRVPHRNASHSGRVKTPGVVPIGPHAARPEGAGAAQAVLRPQAVQQAVDVAGVEGVAAAAAVHERHGIRRRPAAAARRCTSTEPSPPSVTMTVPAPRRWKNSACANRVLLAGDQLRLVVVRQEHIDVRQQPFEAASGSRRAAASTTSRTVLTPRRPGRGEDRGQLVLLQTSA